MSQTQIPFKHGCGLKLQVMRKTATGMREERGAEADRQREANWRVVGRKETEGRIMIRKKMKEQEIMGERGTE